MTTQSVERSAVLTQSLRVVRYITLTGATAAAAAAAAAAIDPSQLHEASWIVDTKDASPPGPVLAPFTPFLLFQSA